MCSAHLHIILLINLIVHDGVPGTSMAREREGVRETPGGGTRRQMALPVWSVEDERNSIFKASTTWRRYIVHVQSMHQHSNCSSFSMIILSMLSFFPLWYWYFSNIFFYLENVSNIRHVQKSTNFLFLGLRQKKSISIYICAIAEKS